jgi:diguanylate cyclase (GGDEF)-like protein/PAS domain S-box-containing protein
MGRYVKNQPNSLTKNVKNETAEHKAQEGEEFFRTITENVDDLIALLDTKGRRIYNSPSYYQVFGNDNLESGSDSFIEIHPDDRERVQAAFFKTVATGVGERIEFRFLLKDGTIRHMESQGSVIRNMDGKVSRVIVVSRDVTDRKKVEEQLLHATNHDNLTGLPNRALLNDRLKLAIATAKRNKGHILALMFIDLDKFKSINDTLGHAIGDKLLAKVATRIQTCLRASDTAARLGGDEFVVLLPSINSHHDALLVAEKIRHAICQPVRIAGQILNVSPSIGIAIYPDNGKDEVELLKNADAAMYSAKQSGRDTVCFYSPPQK